MRKLFKKLNIFVAIGCFFKHTGEWEQIGIAHNGFGETKYKRTCARCEKTQYKVF